MRLIESGGDSLKDRESHGRCTANATMVSDRRRCVMEWMVVSGGCFHVGFLNKWMTQRLLGKNDG